MRWVTVSALLGLAGIAGACSKGAGSGSTGGRSSTGGSSGESSGGGGGSSTDSSSGGTRGTGTGGSPSGGDAGAAGAAGAVGENAGGDGGSGGTPSTPDLYDCAPPEGELPQLTLELVADGFDEPTFVTAAPADPGRLFVVLQRGPIYVIEDGETLAEPFLDLTDQVSPSGNERGLLGLAFHPDYANNGRFFVHYSSRTGVFDSTQGDTIVSEFSVSEDPNLAERNSERLLLTLSQPQANHNGGMIDFGVDGYLYLAFGDGGGGGDPRGWGQNLTNLFGTISRIDVDARDAGAYGIPDGNRAGEDVAPEIWDYGLRNPWRFSVDRCTGDLYIGDVGQNEYEEINVEPFGSGPANYGWSVLEANACYGTNSCDSSGTTLPVLEYGHGDGECVIGGYVYRGSEIPALRGTYIYGDYQSTRIWAFDYVDGVAENHRTLFEAPPLGDGGITSFGQDAAGEIYVVRRGGQILKLVAE